MDPLHRAGMCKKFSHLWYFSYIHTVKYWTLEVFCNAKTLLTNCLRSEPNVNIILINVWLSYSSSHTSSLSGLHGWCLTSKQLGVLPLPPRWDAVHHRVTPQQCVAGTHLYPCVKRDNIQWGYCLRIKWHWSLPRLHRRLRQKVSDYNTALLLNNLLLKTLMMATLQDFVCKQSIATSYGAFILSGATTITLLSPRQIMWPYNVIIQWAAKSAAKDLLNILFQSFCLAHGIRGFKALLKGARKLYAT